jgi:DNA-binding MurR/RpiR family transcriptional regulator
MSAMPPPTADALLDRLAASIDRLSPRLQRAARYVVDHPGEVGVNSMRRLADLAGVTPNTLTRLSRAFDFKSYERFRDLFRDAVRQHARSIPDRARWLQSISGGSSHAALVGRMASAMLLNVEQLYSTADARDLERTARQIIAARTTYVVGIRGAYSLAHNFYYVARMALPNLALIPRQASSPLDDIITIGRRDLLLAITLAPYARETVEAAHYARRRGARIIGVTDSRASPLAPIVDHLLVAPSRTPQFFNSIVASAAILETLLAMIVAVGDRKMLASIRLYDQVRNEQKVYWIDRGSR